MRKEVIEVRDRSKMTKYFEFRIIGIVIELETVISKQIVFKSLALTTGTKMEETKPILNEKEEFKLAGNAIHVDCVIFCTVSTLMKKTKPRTFHRSTQLNV